MEAFTCQNTAARWRWFIIPISFSFSSGSGTFSGTAINLAVKYLDVMTATKD
jgi:hypothetical protein